MIEPLLMHRLSSARSFIYSVGTAVSRAGGKQTADMQAHDASNITAANDPSRVPSSCFAHTLQLAINDGFAIAMSAAGRLVG